MFQIFSGGRATGCAILSIEHIQLHRPKKMRQKSIKKINSESFYLSFGIYNFGSILRPRI
jgi:hypothetical protein